MPVTKLLNNTTLRIITGVAIGLLVLACVIAGGIPLMLLVMYVVYIGSKEYVSILEKKGFKPFLHLIIIADICFVILTALKRFDLVPVVLTFGTIGAFSLVLWKGRQPYIANVATTVLGFIYGGWLPCYVILLRQINQDSLGFFTIKMSSGLGFLILLFFTILMTDVGAYVFGSKFGKRPLAPVVSPKKTQRSLDSLERQHPTSNNQKEKCKMTKVELLAKIELLNQYEMMVEEIKAEADKVRNSIKAEMEAREVEELIAGQYIIRWTSVLSNRFDSTAFKKVMPELYKAYTKQTASRRFTISA